MKRLAIILALIGVFTICFGGLALAGCADCHANIAEGLEGPHKSLGATTDYDSCLRCHKSGNLAMGPVLHKAHLVNNKDFDCKACHAVQADGSIVLLK